jgi:hypothetical protein
MEALMGRKARGKRQADRFLQAWQGRIPWSADEYMVVLNYRKQLGETPHDDWDRRDRGILIAHSDGWAEKYLFNPDAAENQIAYFVRERYRGQPHHVVMTHLMRYFAMNKFFHTHQSRLHEEALIRSDPDGVEGQVEVAAAIVEELATAPYEQHHVDSDGHEYWTYEPEAIIARAKERKRKEDEAETASES